MKPLEVKNWVLTIIQRVQSRQPTEDTRVECKASWLEAKSVVRQLAGHANAAKGEPVLWLIGVDEKGGTIPGAEHRELNNWYPQLVKEFDGDAPYLNTDLNIDVDDKTVVALLFETGSAPFVIRVSNTDRLEIPWREGTRTRSATRAEILRMLSLLQAQGTLIPIKEFADESPKAQALAIERPPYWEHLLTVELLKSKLGPIRRKYDEVHAGQAFRRTQIVTGKHFSRLIQEKMADLIALVQIISSCVQQEVPASWGPSGVPGDAVEIKRAADRLAAACNELVECESDLLSVQPPRAFENIQQLMKGFTSQLLSEVERFPVELAKPFETQTLDITHNITLEFDMASGGRIDQLVAEVGRVSQIIEADPDQWE